MNEDPGGTLNPLNPNPVGPESGPAPEPVAPSPAPEPAPAPAPSPVNTSDPMARPMEKAPVVQAQPKKKKTGLIISILLCLLVAVGCGVTAVLLTMNSKKADPVAAAMTRLLTGQAPTNLAISGNIKIENKDTNSEYSSLPFTKMSADIEGELMLSAPALSVKESITLTMPDKLQDISFDLSEIYTKDKDFYIKINGSEGIIKNFLGDDEEEAVSAVASLIDDEWLHISNNETEEMADDLDKNDTYTCIVNLYSDIEKYSSTVTEIYNQYPFIVSSTEEMAVTSRRDPIFKLSVDSEKLVGFVEAIKSTVIVENLTSCLGPDSGFEINSEEFSGVGDRVPPIYVEINDDYLFTRVYVAYDGSKSNDPNLENMVVTADYLINYPDNLLIKEPDEYKEFSTVISTLFGSSF